MGKTSFAYASTREKPTTSVGDLSTKEDKRESIHTWFHESLTLHGGPLQFQYVIKIRITPWIKQIAVSFNCLKALHLRSVTFFDSDLELLAKTRGKQLRVLKIARCCGFSTDGLLYITRYCEVLRTLCLKDNYSITRQDHGQWLHELALHNTCIESLNFERTYLTYDTKDLALLAKNCSQSLVSLKIPMLLDLVEYRDFFKFAVRLEGFRLARFSDEVVEYVGFKFPPKLRCIALHYMTKSSFPIVLPFLHQLNELDIRCARLNEDDHCFLIQRCPNLKVLYTMSFSDTSVQIIGQFCKKLRKLKITEIDSPPSGFPTHKGLIALAQGCHELECLHIQVVDIANEALESIGAHLKNLRDFHIRLNWFKKNITELPLDNGVRSLLIGCTKLERLNISLRPGGLTDVGLGYIGKYGLNLRYLFLHSLNTSCSRAFDAKSDAGIAELSKGCPKLRKLGIEGCPFSEQAVSSFAFNITSLRYMWVQREYVVTPTMAMTRPNFKQVLL